MELIYTLFFIYAVLPNIYYRYFSRSVIKRCPAKGKVVALTFDDGPDPVYTPKLLDMLKKYDIKCTFFVLASKASKYPGLVKRMIDEGHNVGLHSYRHMNEAFMPPLYTWKNFKKALDTLNELNIRVRLFRPPWGLFNILTYRNAIRCYCKIILWSVHVLDWSRYASVDFIIKRLVNNVKPGDIILLHDGSRRVKDAPKKTIAALDTVIPVLKRKGYSFVLAEELQ